MPGFEIVGEEEKNAILEIFEQSAGVLFAHGFDARRNHIFRVRAFEKAFASQLGSRYGQALSSGTTSLMTALRCAGVQRGDEVITQCFTFVATVEAILASGATPILTEIDHTFNMDPRDLEAKITSKTKAIIPVHMAGNPTRMNEVMTIARKHGLVVIEDTAQAIGATFEGRSLGTIGDMGCYSLDFGKTITTGEGGMLLTDNEALYRVALAYHDHGHEYAPGVGRADDTRQNWGLNFRMGELNAAVGLAQLKKLNHIVHRSRENASFINNRLSCITGVHERETPAGGTTNGDALYYYFESRADCDLALNRLKETGLGTKNVPDAMKWHFAGQWEHIFHAHQRHWPISEDLLARTIALPIMVNWTPAELESHTEKLFKALSLT